MAIEKIKVGSTNHELIASGLTDTSAEKVKLDYTNIAYGTCTTAAATAAKVVSVSGNTNWVLKSGSTISVFFSETNTAESPTLNVNGTGAKNIYYGSSQITTSSLGYAGTANRLITFVYDGTQYRFLSWGYDSNTTYTNVKLGHGYATCDTAASTVAKVGTLSGYTLTTGGIVAVKFTNAVPANSTLNINSKGAKNIYFRGAKITDGIIKAGDVATFIYSSRYHLISIDRWQNDVVDLQTAVDAKVPTSRTVNGKALSSNITLSPQDIGTYTKAQVDSFLDTLNNSIELTQSELELLSDNTSEFIEEVSTTYMTKSNPSGTGSLSLNRKASTSATEYSVAVGYNNTATGRASFAEGEGTTASSQATHAEGYNTKASSYYAHAEGNETTASGRASHAEGQYTVASANSSHAEGHYTKASSSSQHVQGKFNIEDANSIYAHIVGNGESDTARSNAHTLDWDGNAWFAGGVSVGNGQISSKGAGVPIKINPDSTGSDNEHTEIGALKCLGNVHLNSGTGIYGRHSSGGAFRHIAGYDASDNLVYGQDSYINSVNDVYYQGNTVNIRSKNGITIEDNALADFVIETGIERPANNVIVKYAIWNSGVVEYWCKSTESVTIPTAWGSLYYGSVGSLELPSSGSCKISSVDTVTLYAAQSSGSLWLTSGDFSPAPTGCVIENIYAISPAKSTSAIQFTMYAYIKGKKSSGSNKQ